MIITGEHLYLQKMLIWKTDLSKALHRRLDDDIRASTIPNAECALRDVLEHPASHNGRPLVLKEEQVSGGAYRVEPSDDDHLRRPGDRQDDDRSFDPPRVAPAWRALSRKSRWLRRLARLPTAWARQSAQVGARSLTRRPKTLTWSTWPSRAHFHRLLGYSQRTGRFLHHENNRLAERVVIVDEGSMIDLALMERLVRSLRDGSRFILLGDAHQLPSVEAGDVLRDLVTVSARSTDSPRVPFGVWLKDSHRMRADDENGKNILAVAQAIDRGETPVLAPRRTSEP